MGTSLAESLETRESAMVQALVRLHRSTGPRSGIRDDSRRESDSSARFEVGDRSAARSIYPRQRGTQRAPPRDGGNWQGSSKLPPDGGAPPARDLDIGWNVRWCNEERSQLV